jgi:hypothetical protein
MLDSPIRRFLPEQCPEFPTTIPFPDAALHGQAEATVSGWICYSDNFMGIRLLKDFPRICSKLNSALCRLSLGYALDGETERYRLVWAGRTVSVISPSFFFPVETIS